MVFTNKQKLYKKQLNTYVRETLTIFGIKRSRDEKQ